MVMGLMNIKINDLDKILEKFLGTYKYVADNWNKLKNEK